MLLSIITPDKTLTKPIQHELLGVDYELINTHFREGVDIAEGKFIVYLEEGSDFRAGFFIRGLLGMLSNHNFRKLAMISPAVEDFNDRGTLYQFDVAGSRAWDEMRSVNPYPVQVGYVPGAITRAAVLKPLVKDKATLGETTPADLSAAISLALWESGQVVQVDPRMTYLTDITFMTTVVSPSEETVELWRKQSI